VRVSTDGHTHTHTHTRTDRRKTMLLSVLPCYNAIAMGQIISLDSYGADDKSVYIKCSKCKCCWQLYQMLYHASAVCSLTVIVGWQEGNPACKNPFHTSTSVGLTYISTHAERVWPTRSLNYKQYIALTSVSLGLQDRLGSFQFYL